jgi:nucleotide-binding universal stress UspA family protein
MFRCILVPLDGTPASCDALPVARSVARATGATLHLLTVGATSNAGLWSLAEELTRDGIGVNVVTCASGDVAAQIVEYAGSNGIDLVVMATRASGPRSILALTSVAGQVFTDGSYPVLVVRPGDKQIQAISTLLVPVDGTPGGALALAAAQALAHATGSRLVLLQVVVPIPAEAVAALPGMTLGGYIDPEWEGIARAAAQLYVSGLASRIRRVGIPCETRVVTGDVSTSIRDCADNIDADIIVMSTHSATWPARAYLGSVTESVLRTGTHPVLFVHREPRAAEVDRSRVTSATCLA